MHNHIDATDLTDRQWDCISPRIPPAQPGGRPPSVEMRAVLNAMLYVVVRGCQWRLLPRAYPAWQSVYGYFARWRDDGTWQRIHDTVRAAVRRRAGRYTHPTAGCLDSQSVKTTQLPGGRGYASGKQVKGRKRHVLVDTLGVLLAGVVTAAATSDAAGARLLFRQVGGASTKLRTVWVDATYGGKVLRWVADTLWLRLERVLRHDDQRGFMVQPKRWIVERTFAWLTQCRRLSKDYEGLPASRVAMIYIAMTRLMVRRLAHS